MKEVHSLSRGVIPAQAGIHFAFRVSGKMDSRLRGNDVVKCHRTGSEHVKS